MSNNKNNKDVNKNIYMDVAASTKPSKAVIKTMNKVVEEYANPSSMHELGLRAKEIIDESKKNIATILGCKPEELYFTSGATMGNQLAIWGWIHANPDGVIMVNRTEHNDIIELCKYLENNMITVEWIDVDEYGFLDLQQLKSRLIEYKELFKGRRPVLVVCQMANGEIGTIQDMISIQYWTHQFNGTLLSDATQYIANYPIEGLDDYGIDILTMSGQKIHCIKGTGLIYIKDGVNLRPTIFGEQGFIGGTENTIGIACLSTAFTELSKITDKEWGELLDKRNMLIDELSEYGSLVGCTDFRLNNNVAMIFHGIPGEKMVEFLSEQGIYVSSGSACSSHKQEPSHVLKAMGYSDEDASSCVRFTIDNSTTFEDIERVARVVGTIVNMLTNTNDTTAQ